jgi:hypothetical protein
MPPLQEIVSNRRRNKCPIGYTEAATDVMPLRRIYDAIITYLIDNDVADPVDYMSPKSINSSLADVR